MKMRIKQCLRFMTDFRLNIKQLSVIKITDITFI